MAHIKDVYLKRKRDRDLFECYRLALEEHHFETQHQAVDYARKHAAPRFYISAHSAADYINSLLAGRSIGNVNASSERRIKEIYRRFKEIRQIPEHSEDSVISICRDIVTQPAPEFYVGHDLAMKAVCREAKQHNDRMARLARRNKE